MSTPIFASRCLMGFAPRLAARAVTGAVIACTALPAMAQVERISISTAGAQGNSQSRYPVISANGRYVAFVSDATNLVAGDTNGFADVFVRDRLLGTTTRISNMADGSQSDAASGEPSISGDGMRIVFTSNAKLIASASWFKCYLLDRTTGALSFVDVRSDGSPGTGGCSSPSIDVSGRRIAFTTYDGLVAGDTQRQDVYVRDLVANTLSWTSLGLGGAQTDLGAYASRISGDGSRVLFASQSSNLVAGDSNGKTDLFLAASDASVPISRVSVGAGNVQAETGSSEIGALNANGSLLAFSSKSQSLPDWYEFAESTLYLRIPSTDATVPIVVPNARIDREGFNEEPDFDYSGRYLVFASTDQIAANGEPGVYVVDLVRGLMTVVSVGGQVGNVHQPRLSADGTGVVWYSLSTQQVPNDTNGTWDVFYAPNPLYDDTLFRDGFDGA